MIEVLHIDDCPNWIAAGQRIEEALALNGTPNAKVTYRLIESAEEAALVPFAGSPTITLDGRDLFPNGGVTRDLACRIYFTPEGTAGLPTVEQISEAIASHEH